MTVVAISGSPSAASRSLRILECASDRLAEMGIPVESIQVRDLPAEPLLRAASGNPEIATAVGKVARAQAILVATPIYKAAYSGLLKTFLDLLPLDAFAGKIVLPMVTGGSPVHLASIDEGLRRVLDALNPHAVLPGVYALDAEATWSEQAGFRLSAEVAARLDEGIDRIASYLRRTEPQAHEPSLLKTHSGRS